MAPACRHASWASASQPAAYCLIQRGLAWEQHYAAVSTRQQNRTLYLIITEPDQASPEHKSGRKVQNMFNNMVFFICLTSPGSTGKSVVQAAHISREILNIEILNIWLHKVLKDKMQSSTHLPGGVQEHVFSTLDWTRFYKKCAAKNLSRK